MQKSVRVWTRRALRVTLLLLTVATLGYSALAVFIRHDFQPRHHRAGRPLFFNRLVYAVGAGEGPNSSALTCCREGFLGPLGRREPLLVTAHGLDVLFVPSIPRGTNSGWIFTAARHCGPATSPAPRHDEHGCTSTWGSYIRPKSIRHLTIGQNPWPTRSSDEFS